MTDLVGDLLFDLRGQAGALPLLQFTLDQLFAQRAGPAAHGRGLQGAGRRTRRPGTACRGHLCRATAEEHRLLARALFLRLIDPGATEQDTTRRRAPMDRVRAARSLRRPSACRRWWMHSLPRACWWRRAAVGDAAETTVEVSHEALIREWEPAGRVAARGARGHPAATGDQRRRGRMGAASTARGPPLPRLAAGRGRSMGGQKHAKQPGSCLY